MENNEGKKLIAVMGATGSGKSTFVRLVTGDETVKVGDNLTSETSKVTPYSFISQDGTKFEIIDTPGFDDTNLSDREVLQTLSEWLATSYRAGTKLTGILYTHRISDPRMQGSALRNLAVFKSLCGEDFFSSIVLYTTFWDSFPNGDNAAILEAREKELISTEHFWGGMKSRGSTTYRCTSDQDSARRLVHSMLYSKAKALKIQQEMVDEGIKFDDTSANACYWQQKLEKQEQESQQRLQEERRIFEQQLQESNEKGERALKEQREEFERTLQKAEKSRRLADLQFKSQDAEFRRRRETLVRDAERMRLQRVSTEERIAARKKLQDFISSRGEILDTFYGRINALVQALQTGKANNHIAADLSSLKHSYTTICGNCFKTIGYNEYYSCRICRDGDFNVCRSCYEIPSVICDDPKHRSLMTKQPPADSFTQCPRAVDPPQTRPMSCVICAQNMGICYLHCCACSEVFDVCVDCVIRGAHCKGHARRLRLATHKLEICFRYIT